MKYFLIVSLVLLFQQGKPPVVPKITGSRISRQDAQKALEAHNRYRSTLKKKIQPLQWSAKLSAVAQKWADTLAASGCDLVHSDTEYGENLHWGGGPVDASESWYSEKKHYTYGVFTGKQKGIGHYTQMVWKNTKEVGMGIAICPGGDTIVVANYYPAGNFVDEMPY